MTRLEDPQPKCVSVSKWGELRGEQALPNCLRVLVGGQSAGGCERKGSAWIACFYIGMSASGQMRDRISEHASAEDAVRAVVRSAWARKLGARASSAVSWSAKASRAAGRQAVTL
jgi:hypothetical protein